MALQVWTSDTSLDVTMVGCRPGRERNGEGVGTGMSVKQAPNDCTSLSEDVSCRAGGKALQRVPEGRHATALEAWRGLRRESCEVPKTDV